MKTSQTSSLLAALCSCILGIVGNASAVPVALQQPTATFSQTYSGNFSVSKAIDGTTADNLGWAIAQGAATDLPAQTAVFEMVTNVGFTGGSRLTFTFLQTHDFDFVYHTLGRFRISVTTDDRSLFADGLPTGGDVTANWTALNPDTIVSSNGATLTKLGDLSVLASGTSPYQDIYTISAATTLTDITGIRIEAMKDASLPFGGPGRQPLNGNFVLSELLVSVTPETTNPPVINCTPAPTGLVSWWPGENQATDAIGGNNGAELNGASYVTGKVGQAFSFDGMNDHVRVANSMGLTPTNAMTVEAWIFPTVSSAFQDILSKWDAVGGVNQRSFTLKLHPNGHASFGASPTGTDALSMLVESTHAPALNQWTHVAGTYDGAALRIFVNGIEENSGSYNLGIFPGTTDIAIGGVVGGVSSGTVGSPFAGLIDEPSLYNRALTPAEIQAIVAAGSAGKCPLPPPPVITQHPQNRTNNANATALFAVAATGAPTLRYQWFFAGNPLPNATNSSLSISNASLIHQGTYFVTVSNDFGFAISSNATLTVLTFPPVITGQPTNVTAIETTAASFSVQATGSVTLAYQWLLNGAPLAGKTTTTLSFTSVQLSNAGNYSVIVTNPYGAVTSSVAVLTVNPIPTCVAVHDGLVSWWKGENNAIDNWDSNNGSSPFGTSSIAGKVGLTWRTPFINVNDSPSLRVTNGLTLEAWVNPSTLSSVRVLVSKFDYPLFQPGVSQSAYLLGTTNNGALFFALTPNGSVRTNTTLVTTNLIPLNQWTHVAATYDGSVMRLYINGSQIGQTNYTGKIFPGSVPLGIGGFAGPSFPTSSPWQYSGLMDEVSLYNRALSAAEIQSIVAADLTGKCPAPPVVTKQPDSQIIPLGEDVKFSVEVYGSRPLAYQWYSVDPIRPNVRIIGATNATLLIEKIRATNAGYYFVTVTNSVGSNYSALAQLSILPAPFCVDVLPGLISWWPGDSNTLDAIGPNNITTYSPLGYPTGKVASAFTFNGSQSRITVNNSASLNFGANTNFSIEMWIKATNTPSSPQGASIYPNVPLLEKRTGDAAIWVGYSLSLNQGRLAFAMGIPSPGGPGVSSFISTSPDLRDSMFHHVAVTVNRAATNGGVLYVDGAPVLTFDPTPRNSTLVNSSPLYIGAPTTTISNSYFNGLIDEPALYNRALTAAEILSIRTAGAAGRCKSRPTIITQPANVSVQQGSNTTLTVQAIGSPLLRYQWRRNSQNLAFATNTSLTITNVTAANAGTYSVIVSNLFGLVTSSNAVVTVSNRPPVAFPSSFVLNEDTYVNMTLNAVSYSGNPLIYIISSPPTNGYFYAPSTTSSRIYIPNQNYSGPDSFTFLVSDNIGRSAPVTVTINVLPVNDAPVAFSEQFSVDEDTALPIQLRADDVDDINLAFEIVQQPAHGTLTGSGPKRIYTPGTNYFGDDYFTFIARDGSNAASQMAVISITIRPVNDAPVAKIVVTPLDQLPGETNTVLISPACCDTTLVLDGSQSSDVENVPLTYIWMDGTNVIATTATFTNQFAPGVHELALIVSDGELTGTELLTIEILKTEDAVAHLISLVQASSLARNEKAALGNWLRVTVTALEHCNVDQAVMFLERFEGRVAERISAINAKDAERWVTISQAIREVAGLCETTDRPCHDKDEDEDKDKPKHDKSDEEKSDRDRSGSGNSKVEKATAKAGQENRGDRGNSDDVRAGKSSLR